MKMIYLSPGSIQEADPSAESSYGKTITLSFHNIIINNFIIMATLKKKRITPLYAPVNKKKKDKEKKKGGGGEGTNCRSSIERRWDRESQREANPSRYRNQCNDFNCLGCESHCKITTRASGKEYGMCAFINFFTINNKAATTN